MDATAAVVMTLLVQDATFTGGSEHDVLAARSWHNSKAMIARAEPTEAEDLMFPPDQALARIAPWSEVGRLIALAQEDNPHAEVIEEFTAAGWSTMNEDGLWEITGSFGNPVPVAARAAERFGRHHPNGVLVQASSENRWVFVAWAAPPPPGPAESPGSCLAHLRDPSSGHTGIPVQRRRPLRGARPCRCPDTTRGRSAGCPQEGSCRSGPAVPGVDRALVHP